MRIVLAAGVSFLVLCAGCTDECENVVCQEGLICDEISGGSCRPPVCFSDSACTGVVPHCNTSLHLCVPCVTSAHCDPGQKCGTVGNVPACVVPVCAADPDCADVNARPRCNTDQHLCVACLVNADCGEGRQCKGGGQKVCVPIGPCTSHSDCVEPKPYCDFVRGKCEECTLDKHCPAQQNARVCNLDTHACSDGPCDADEDCEGATDGPACRLDTGRCVECNVDGQCADSQVGPNCHPDFHVCLPCVADDDCDTEAGFNCGKTTFQCFYGGCLDDAMCFGRTVCKLPERDCVRCRVSADCTLGGVCNTATGACVASVCTGDANCPWPQRCLSNACVQCLSDADCPVGTCSAAHACVAPPPCTAASCLQQCTEDLQCPEGRVCRAGACTLETACVDDEFEVNDTPYSASGLAPTVSDITWEDTDEGKESAGYVSAVACRRNQDWYSLEAYSGQQFDAEVRYDRTLGELGVELVCNSYTGSRVVGTATPTPLGADLSVPRLPPGCGPTAYMGILGGPRRIPYRLIMTCRDDIFDSFQNQGIFGQCPNDEPLCATIVSSSGLEGTACQGDDDWFHVTVPGNKRVIVRAIDQANAIFVTLFRAVYTTPTNVTLNYEDVDDDFDVAASVAQPVQTEYWVRLSSFGSRSVDYVLDIQFRDPQPLNDSCTTPQAAQTLASGVTAAGTFVEADGDFYPSCGIYNAPDVVYKVSLATPKHVVVEAQAGFPIALAALVQGCNWWGGEHACRDGLSDRIELSLKAGEHHFLVSRDDGGVGGTFTIRATITDPPVVPQGDACTDAPLLAGTMVDDVSLAVDNDKLSCAPTGRGDAFYRLSFSQPQSLYLSLAASFSGATLGLRSGCGGAQLGCQQSQSAELFFPKLQAGDYRVIVDGGSPLGGPYTLSSVVDLPLNDMCVDSRALADGSTSLASTRFATHQYAESCSSATAGRDAVWHFTVPGAEPMSAHLGLEPSFEGVLAVFSSCVSGPLACSAGSAPAVDLDLLDPGTYSVVVDGRSDADFGPYGLSLSLTPAPPVPANDACSDAPALEFDGSGHAATDGTLVRATDGGGCGPVGPDVNYRVTLQPGQTLAVTATAAGFSPTVDLIAACGAAACLDTSVPGTGMLQFAWPDSMSDPLDVVLVIDAETFASPGAFSLSADRTP